MALRMDAELLPGRLRKLDVIVFRSLLNVLEGQSPIFVGDACDLIEAGDGIAYVPRIGQRLFAVFRKRKNGVRQFALRSQPPMFLVRDPGCLHWHLLH